MNAYDKIYLEKARVTLGSMLDFAVNIFGYDLRTFWNLFLHSSVSEQFAKGKSSVLAGKSGIELCYEVTGKENEVRISPPSRAGKSPTYWAGWALAYYQWSTGYSFAKIEQIISIENIEKMFFPYHEMDIRQFCDRINDIAKSKHTETNLKRIRKSRGVTQRLLAEQTHIPLRTIQQYEQGQKSINGARSEYLVLLAKALYCEADELLEPITFSLSAGR